MKRSTSAATFTMIAFQATLLASCDAPPDYSQNKEGYYDAIPVCKPGASDFEICTNNEKAARTDLEANAPKYSTLIECEDQHQKCSESASSTASSGGGHFVYVPYMYGYAIPYAGAAPTPVYRERSPSGSYSRATPAMGARTFSLGPSGIGPTPSMSRAGSAVAARGGFGAVGHGFASAGG